MHTEGSMTGDEFAAARKRVGVTQEQWGEMLGISRFTVIDYERGTRRSDGQPVAIPKAHELACVALELGVRSYGDLAKHRADDRAYVRWAAKQLELPRRALEQQGRRLFPEVWNQYPYSVIAPEAWDEPEFAERAFRDLSESIPVELRTLPVARHDQHGWDLKVLTLVTPTLDDIVYVKLMWATPERG